MEQLIEFAGNNFILSAIWVGLVVWLLYSFVNSAFSPIKELGTHDATLQINKQDAVVLDIRPPFSFFSLLICYN